DPADEPAPAGVRTRRHLHGGHRRSRQRRRRRGRPGRPPLGGVSMSASTRITVPGEQPYDVVVGEGLLGELPALVGDGVQRVLVVHPKALRATGEAVRDDLTTQGFEAYVAEVPDAEEAKTAQVAA